jgi:hypothetical protein
MEAEIPAKKVLSDDDQDKVGTPVAGTDGFMNIPDGVDEEVPFA